MELKVWVEGIQRVVCGVTEKTTCQDVVYALAHATGQMGRFTMIERWQGNERPLPPQEQPLRVLANWGEYASNVQFILRRSQADKKVKSPDPSSLSPNTQAPGVESGKKLHDNRSFSPISPPGSNHPAGGGNKELKKSFTFSGSHAGGGVCGNSSGSGQTLPNSLRTVGLSKECTSEIKGISTGSKGHRQSPGLSRTDIPKGIIKGVPQQSEVTKTSHRNQRESPTRGDRPKKPPSYDEAVSRSSRIASHTQSGLGVGYYPPSSASPLSSLPSLPTVSEGNDAGTSPLSSSPSSSKKPILGSFSNLEQAKREVGLLQKVPEVMRHQPTVAKLSSIQTLNNNNPKVAWGDNRSSDASRTSILGSVKKTLSGVPEAEETGLDKNDFLNQSLLSPNANNRPNTAQVQAPDPQSRDLIRLVNLQREKLNSQNAELSQYDSEIVYWEKKLQEQEEKLQTLEEELQRLDKAFADHEEEISTMEHHQPLLVEAIERGRQDDCMLRSKLSVIRAQVANCETEVLQCRQKMRELLEELAEERQRATSRQEVEELQTQKHRTELQVQLKGFLVEGEKQKSLFETLEEELKALEEDVSSKKHLSSKLAQQLREENLQSLSLNITEDIKMVAEGSFQNRSGSTRRIMGSPRQLENAVATSKNPHGVWV